MNAIETHELTRVFGKGRDERVAVDKLSLTIPQGQVFGFLGPNGAGKTTTVRMLCALIQPSGGSASVNGFPVGKDNPDIRSTVGILTETPGLYDRLTAMQNLVFFGGLYELSDARASEQAEKYLKLMDLWDRRNDKVGGFSKGMRQKLAIARALLHDPATVFFDEPTAGLDPEASRTVHEFIRDLRSQGKTIFLTTHNLTEADALCDIIGVFRTHLIRIGTPEQLRNSLFGSGTQVTTVGDAAPWVATVQTMPLVKSVSAQGNLLMVSLDNPEAANPALVQALVTAGAPIKYVEPITHSLEDVYLEIVSEGESTAAGK